MPRLSTSLLRRARRIDSLLPLLLRECRDLDSARNELRWLRDHVTSSSESHLKVPISGHDSPSDLYELCLARSRGKPLQYILGNQPFGDLDILCRPGVLIPRPETETYTTFLAHRLVQYLTKACPSPNLRSLAILDLCTGTGCIPLLLHQMLQPHVSSVRMLGIDISSKALALARTNLKWNINQGHMEGKAAEQIRFEHGNVLAGTMPVHGNWDVLVSNPPYISPKGFLRDTASSVRNFEPRLALVPPLPASLPNPPSDAESDAVADMFYRPLLHTAQRIGAKVVVFEIADQEQANRVIQIVADMEERIWDGCEIWHDGIDRMGNHKTFREIEGLWRDMSVRDLGDGQGRAVVFWRGEGRRWLGDG